MLYLVVLNMDLSKMKLIVAEHRISNINERVRIGTEFQASSRHRTSRYFMMTRSAIGKASFSFQRDIALF